MLRKMLFFILAVCVLSVSPNPALAKQPHVPYLYGDTDYIYCAYHDRAYYYIDKTSVEIESDDPSEHIISADILVCLTYEDDKILEQRRSFLYDYDTKEIYIEGDPGEWILQVWDEPQKLKARYTLAGEMAYYIAHGTGFATEAKNIAKRIHPEEETELH